MGVTYSGKSKETREREKAWQEERQRKREEWEMAKFYAEMFHQPVPPEPKEEVMPEEKEEDLGALYKNLFHISHEPTASPNSLKEKLRESHVPINHAPVANQPIKEPYSKNTPTTAPEGSKREYYIVGKRPLAGKEKIYSDSKLPLVGKVHHEHFIANDGTNIGRLADASGGITADAENLWDTYVYKDSKKYNAQLIDEAVSQYAKGKEQKMQKIVLPGDKVWPGDNNNYSLTHQNCQHYVDDIIKMAEKLSKKSGRPLYIE